MAHTPGAYVSVLVLVLCFGLGMGGVAEWGGEEEPLLGEEDSLRLVQASIEMDWGESGPINVNSMHLSLEEGRTVGETALAGLLEEAGASTFIRPIAASYSANRTVFVASMGGSFNSSTCGSIEDPCASLAQALSLSSSIVLLPGDHIVLETVAVRNRSAVTILGVMGDTTTRPKVLLAPGAPRGPLLRLVEVRRVNLDSISFSEWSCDDVDQCRSSAVEVISSQECSLLNCLFQNNTKDLTSVNGYLRGCSLTFASFAGGQLHMKHCSVATNVLQVKPDEFVNVVGSAVTIFGANATLLGCSFLGNSGKSFSIGHNSPVVFYGTVYSLGGIQVLDSAFVSSNLRCGGYFCSSFGGAVYNTARRPYPSSPVQVSGSLFFYCFVSAAFPGSAFGGALVIFGHDDTHILDSTFESNFITAGSNVAEPLTGGSIYVSGYEATVQHCDFLGNSVCVNAGVPGNTGGGGAAAFAVYAGGLVLRSCHFEANRVFGTALSSGTGSSAFGGAVYVDGSIDAWNCTFSSNTVAGGDASLVGGFSAGGAFMQFYRFGSATVRNCRFVANEAAGGSGALAALSVGGGAVAASGPFRSFYSIFIGNTATGGSLNVTDSRFVPPRAGGAAVGGAALLQFGGEVQECLFEGNEVRSGGTTKGTCGPIAGGALATTGGLLRINNTDFLRNLGSCGEHSCDWCTAVGGGVAVANSFISMNNARFQDNSLQGGRLGRVGSVFGAAFGTLVRLDGFSCLVESSTFASNTIAGGRAFGGAVFAGADSMFTGTLFVANVATAYEGAYGGAMASRPNIVKMLRSTVADNSASSLQGSASAGGAVYATNWGNLWTTGSTFSRNSANYGGVAFFWSSTALMPTYDYTLEGLFLDNFAFKLGGVAYFHDIPLQSGEVDCILVGSGNKAPCGNGCAGAVYQGVQLGSFMDNVWPGQPQNLAFGLLDAFGQVCQRNFYAIQSTNGTAFQTEAPQDQVTSSPQGIFTIPGVQVFGGAGTVHTLETSLSSTATFDWYPAFILESEFHLRQCSPSHFLVSNSSCTPCDSQTYNFDGSVCKGCPLDGQQCIRLLDKPATKFQIVRGFYPTSFMNPVSLDACPLLESCPAYNCSITPADDDVSWNVDCGNCRHVAEGLDCTCTDGYTGRLCSQCVFNEDQCYFRSNGHCVNAATLPLGLWGPGLEFVCYVVVTVAFFSLRQDAEKGTMKTLLFFVQTTAAFSSGVIYPFGLVNLLASLTSGMVLNWLNVAALRCLSYNIFSSRVVVVSLLTLMPVVLFLPLVVLVHVVSLVLKEVYSSRSQLKDHVPLLLQGQSPNASPQGSRVCSPQPSPSISPQGSPSSSPRQSPCSSPPTSPLRSGEQQPLMVSPINLRDRLIDKCIHSALYIQYAAFFSICNILFVSWGCEKQDSTGKWFGINMPWLQCGEGEWLQLLVATSLLSLVCVLLPCCLFAYVLYKNRNSLDDPTVIRRYGFLYGSYKRDFYYWELLALLRRLALSFSLSAFAKSESLYYCFPIAVHLISAACQIQFQPLHTKRENMMEVLAIFSVIFSFEASHRINSRESLVDFDTWFVEAAVLLVNGAVLGSLLWIIGKELKDEYREKVMRYYGRLVDYSRQLRSIASFQGAL